MSFFVFPEKHRAFHLLPSPRFVLSSEDFYPQLHRWYSGDIRDKVPSLGQEDPLEEGMATHSSTLAFRISWTEEPGGLQSMGS